MADYTLLDLQPWDNWSQGGAGASITTLTATDMVLAVNGGTSGDYGGVTSQDLTEVTDVDLKATLLIDDQLGASWGTHGLNFNNGGGFTYICGVNARRDLGTIRIYYYGVTFDEFSYNQLIPIDVEITSSDVSVNVSIVVKQFGVPIHTATYTNPSLTITSYNVFTFSAWCIAITSVSNFSLSAGAPVDVTPIPKKLSFMADTTPYTKIDVGDVICGEPTTSLMLNMHRAIDTNGIVSWIDMGSVYDTIKSSFPIELDLAGSRIFEQYTKNKGSSTTTNIKNIAIYDAAGFYPLSQMYKSNLIAVDDFAPDAEIADGAFEYQLSLLNMPQPDNVNMFSDAVQYTLEVAPIKGLLVASDSITPCSAYNGWTLGGVDLPYSENEFNASLLNTNSLSTQLNDGTDNSFRVGRTYGEVAEISVLVDTAKAKELLLKIKSERGSQITCTFPLAYNPFAHIYEGVTDFYCILFNNDIGIKSLNHNNIEISFKLQVVGLV